MKRFFAIILASVLLLTACGKQVTTRQDGSAEQTLVLQLGGYSLYFAAAAS